MKKVKYLDNWKYIFILCRSVYKSIHRWANCGACMQFHEINCDRYAYETKIETIERLMSGVLEGERHNDTHTPNGNTMKNAKRTQDQQ